MTDSVAVTREQQTQLYGAPLNDVMGRCAATLGLNQSGLAQVLGISQPMLSQLINGHRIKIANPVADQRLRLVSAWADRVAAGEASRAQALLALEQSVDPDLASSAATRGPENPAATVQEVFRASASAQDYLDAAGIIAADYPDVAQLLRIYGAARLDIAAEHTQTLLRRRG